MSLVNKRLAFFHAAEFVACCFLPAAFWLQPVAAMEGARTTAGTGGSVAADITDNENPFLATTRVPVLPAVFAFLVDDSRAMYEPKEDSPAVDPGGVRYQAIQVTCALASKRDYLIVVKFRHEAETAVPLRKLGSLENRRRLQAAIGGRLPDGMPDGRTFYLAMENLLGELDKLDEPVLLYLFLVTADKNFSDAPDPFAETEEKKAGRDIGEPAGRLAAMSASGGKLRQIVFRAIHLVPEKGPYSAPLISDLYTLRTKIFATGDDGKKPGMKRDGGEAATREQGVTPRQFVLQCIRDAAAADGAMLQQRNPADPASRLVFLRSPISSLGLVVSSPEPSEKLLAGIRLLGPRKDLDLSASSIYQYPDGNELHPPVTGESHQLGGENLYGGPISCFHAVRLEEPDAGFYEILSSTGVGPSSPGVTAVMVDAALDFRYRLDAPPPEIFENQSIPVGLLISGKPKQVAGWAVTMSVSAVFTDTLGNKMSDTVALVPRIAENLRSITYSGKLASGLKLEPLPDGSVPESAVAAVSFCVELDTGGGKSWDYRLPPRYFTVLADKGRVEITVQPYKVVKNSAAPGATPFYILDERKADFIIQLRSTYEVPKRVRLEKKVTPGGFYAPSLVILPEGEIVLHPNEPVELKLHAVASAQGDYECRLTAFLVEEGVEEGAQQRVGAAGFRVRFPSQTLALKRHKPIGDRVDTDGSAVVIDIEALSSYYEPIDVLLSVSQVGSFSSSGSSPDDRSKYAAAPLDVAFEPSARLRLSPDEAQTFHVTVTAPTDGVYAFSVRAMQLRPNLSITATDSLSVTAAALSPEESAEAEPLDYIAVFRKRDIYMNTKLFKLDMGRYPLGASPRENVMIEVPGEGPFLPAASGETSLSNTPAAVGQTVTVELFSRRGSRLKVEIDPLAQSPINLGTYSQFMFGVLVPSQEIEPDTYAGEVILSVYPDEIGGAGTSEPIVSKRMQMRVEFYDPLHFHKTWLPVVFALTVAAMLLLFIWLVTPRFEEQQLRIMREGKPLYEVYLLSMHTHGLAGKKSRATPEFPRAVKFTMTGLSHFTRIRCIMRMLRDDVEVTVNDMPLHEKGCEINHGDTIRIRGKHSTGSSTGVKKTGMEGTGEIREFAYMYFERNPNETELPRPRTITIEDDDIIIVED